MEKKKYTMKCTDINGRDVPNCNGINCVHTFSIKEDTPQWEKKWDELISQMFDGIVPVETTKNMMKMAIQSLIKKERADERKKVIEEIKEYGASITIPTKKGNCVEWFPNGLLKFLNDKSKL